MSQIASSKLDIQISVTDKAIAINDCWIVLGLNQFKQRQCYTSNYDVNSYQEILNKGQKIGDIFPNRIIIYLGNDQAAEQMIFELNGLRQLRFNYSFVSYDGGMISRFGILGEVH